MSLLVIILYLNVLIDMTIYYSIDELTTEIGVNKRKLRYWMQECALVDKRIPGQTAYYSRETFERLSFIKKILDLEYEPSKGKFKPTLPQIKDFLEQISLDQIRDVLSGKEPLEVGYLADDEDGNPAISTLSDELLSASSSRYGDIVQSEVRFSALRGPDPLEARESGSALDYISTVMSEPPKPRQKRPWQILRISKDLELRHRSALNPQQEQQLRLAGKLIQSILSKEK